MENDGVYHPELRKIQKSLEQCWLDIKSYCCVNIYEDNCCVAVVLGYHIIVSTWKPVPFCYSYKKYINIAERNQHSKVERIIISFNTICNMLISSRKNLGVIEIVPHLKIGPRLLCARMYAVLKNFFFSSKLDLFLVPKAKF